MSDTVWIVTGSAAPTETLAYMLDAMSAFDRDHYQAEAKKHGLELLLELDWMYFWTEGDEAHDTREAAIAYAEEHDLDPRRILEITKDDAREALRIFTADQAAGSTEA